MFSVAPDFWETLKILCEFESLALHILQYILISFKPQKLCREETKPNQTTKKKKKVTGGEIVCRAASGSQRKIFVDEALP